MNFRVVLYILCMALISSGCAVTMAAKAPNRKDVSVLTPGNSRDIVMAELGVPAVEKVGDDGLKYDIFKFTKGYTGGEKFLHAAGHGVMDVATLGLWEVIGTPSESMAQHNEIMVKVLYDKDEMVKEVIPLKDQWNELEKIKKEKT